jgi:hypothetical protein
MTIQAIWAAGGTPSIDRIDSDGHYSADNIQFIPWAENGRKARRGYSRANLQQEKID